MAAGLTTRMRTFFLRQIAWLQTRLDELSQFDAQLDEAQFQAMAATEMQRARELEHLQREAAALLREWRGGVMASEEERNEVQELSARARELVTELVTRCQLAAEETHEAEEEVAMELNALRRAQGTLRKYRPAVGPDEGRIDRRA